MKQGLRLIESALKPRPVAPPALLLTLEPWHKAFLDNLREHIRPRPQPSLKLSSPAAPFWTDVFIASHLPWSRFAQSVVLQAALVGFLWSGSRLWPQKPRVITAPVFQKPDVVYYDAQEYLPPLDTGSKKVTLPQKGDPEHAAQPILSVPPEADNHKQTIVAPPNLKLDHDVPLPNVVAWNQVQPTIPLAATAARPSDLKIPTLPTSVIAPPPEVSRNKMDRAPSLSDSAVAPAPDLNAAVSKRDMRMPQPSVVEPPPSVATASTRRLGDINIGHAQVVAPAPQLPMGEQHTRASVNAPTLGSAAVVPPPPSIQGNGVANKGGRLIALGIHPAAVAPVEAPNGNRRGSFAANPDGKAGAAGTPNIVGNSRAAGSPGSQGNSNGIPPGLVVGPGPKSATAATVAGSGHASASDPSLVASASPPRTSATGRKVASVLSSDAQTEDERKVFAGRRSYGMTLSVPNLNSSGGSWVMHFSELKDGETKGDLMAPVATRAVDPGYPLELMRKNVQGTVTLSAVINSDGRVADVKVLNGIDDQLDAYASAALLRWQFLPALKNGSPIPLQAVVMIPFRPMRKGF
jgi:TonB family protein